LPAEKDTQGKMCQVENIYVNRSASNNKVANDFEWGVNDSKEEHPVGTNFYKSKELIS